MDSKDRKVDPNFLVRGLHEFNGEFTQMRVWIVGFLCYDDGEDSWTIWKVNETGNNGGWYQVDPETIGRCTGKKDKNGNLIFEGDILGYSDSPEAVALVVWRGFGWAKRIWSDGDQEYYHPPIDPVDQEYCFVVGNIHENAALLKRGIIEETNGEKGVGASVKLTMGAILDSGHWAEYCEDYGVNFYAVNEGLATRETEVEISLKDANRYGIK